VRVAIVEPSAPLQRALRAAVTLYGADEVAWSASDGAEALRSAQRAPPDLILVGVAALRGGSPGLIAALGRPVVVVSASVVRDVSAVYGAMSDGACMAVDFVFPDGDTATHQAFVRQFRRAVASPARPAPSGPSGPSGRSAPSALAAASAPSAPFFVALGASTGGPAALCEVLRGMGRDFPVPVVIVQHIEPTYMASLAEQLSRDGGIPVDLSSRSLHAVPGRALLAATSEHLTHASQQRFAHLPPLAAELHHPSVDALFLSLARGPTRGAAALLTGMGRDGAAGLLSLRRAGWFTIAQDERSCVVHGMPKAAAALGAAVVVRPRREIGAELRRRADARGGP
jgi:two-component system, chemotaxis family, response regulator WspF